MAPRRSRPLRKGLAERRTDDFRLCAEGIAKPVITADAVCNHRCLGSTAAGLRERCVRSCWRHAREVCDERQFSDDVMDVLHVRRRGGPPPPRRRP